MKSCRGTLTRMAALLSGLLVLASGCQANAERIAGAALSAKNEQWSALVTNEQIIAAVNNPRTKKKSLAGLIAGLPDSDRSALVTLLIPSLRSGEWRTQENAAIILGCLGPVSKPAVPALIESMDARMENVAWAAAPAIGKIGSSTVPDLIAALKVAGDTPKRVYHLMSAFAELGPQALGAAPYIVPYLDRGSNNGANKALEKLGPKAIPHILKGLESDSRGVINYSAATVLTTYGSASGTALAKFLSNTNPLGRRNASYVLTFMEPSAIRSTAPQVCRLLKDADSAVRMNAFETLKKIGPSAVPDLTELLSDPDKEVYSNVAALLQIYGSGAKAALPALTSKLTSNNAEISMMAASTILKIEPNRKDAVQKLLAFLHDNSSSTRQSAAHAIARAGAGASSTVPDLIKALNDSESFVRHAAITALAEIGPPAHQSVSALTVALTSTHPPLRSFREELGNDDNVYRAALTALGKIGPASAPAIPVLIKLLGDPQKQYLSSYIYDALKGMGPAAAPAVPALISLLSNSSTDRTRILELIASIGPGAKDALPNLRTLIEGRDSSLRRNAFSAILAVETNPGRKQQDARKMLNDTDMSVREKAVEVFVQYPTKDPDCIAALLSRLKSDFQIMQGLLAVKALGNAGPAAQDALPFLVGEYGKHYFGDGQKNVVFEAIKKIDPSGDRTISLVKPNLNDCFKVRDAVRLLDFIATPASKVEAAEARKHWKLD